ncbi:Bet v1-like protein [Gigaspora margarita]|uniref:Bet v1-like protein n=1 Tax=Gigaspora margarita TaxID=4874 RepID=A0A8H4A3N8_GIGMA|nr:Bet v1-like protein [Gigaspora margarita]
MEDDIEFDDKKTIDECLDDYLDDESEGSNDFLVKSVVPPKVTAQHYVEKAKLSLIDLKIVVKELGWRKIIKDKNAVVYSKRGSARNRGLPIFMGQCEIRGFNPLSIFTVIGRRRLWDDWFEEGNVIENLDDTTSLTYMAMQGISGSRARDLSLLEKVEWSSNGTIYFVSSSINTEKIPHVPGKIRSFLSLSGWILEPISSNPLRTKVTYIVQIHVKGWIPAVVAKKYLSRRPLVINKINNYLQRHGAPELSLPPTPSISTHTSVFIDRNELNNNNERLPATPVVPDDKFDVSEDNHEKENYKFNHDQSPLASSSEYSPEHGYKDFTIPSTHQSISSSENIPKLLQEPKSEPSILKEPIVKKEKKEKSHHHQDAASEAIEMLKSLARDQYSWVLYSESKGVKVYQKDNPGKSVPYMRGDITIYGNFLPEDICQYAVSLDARKLWDDRYEEGTTVERYSFTEVLTRSAMKGTFPISGRDFAMICTVDRDPDGTIWCAATSIIDPKIPENKKYVRADLILAGWELRPVYDSAGNRSAIEVKYIVDIDIKLDSVPSRILKSISMQTPMCVAKIDELLKTIGFPPYIRYTTGEIIHEEFNVDNFRYDLILSNNGEGFTEIRTSDQMYPNGFNISIQPTDVKADLHPNDKGVFCITVPASINAKELSISITRNTSYGIQITYNGIKLLRAITKSENRDNKTRNENRDSKLTTASSINKVKTHITFHTR